MDFQYSAASARQVRPLKTINPTRFSPVNHLIETN